MSSFIYFVDGLNQVRTNHYHGSKDEEKYFKVLISSGSVLDSDQKYYFKSKKAYQKWNRNSRDQVEKDGGLRVIS